ncbi:YcxB family protein [Streptomyces sp. NPDC094032]|uniref:YcxB family protein n=1 Tax=Streptomyces sp. NPDC094032 TaxID=3155308 RepID=UPI00332564EA
MVELVYTPTRDDVFDAVRVQMRFGTFRRARVLMRITTGLAAVALAVLFFLAPGEPPVGGMVFLAALGLMGLVLVPLMPRLTARQLFPLIERQGEHQARVEEDGVRWTSRDSEVVGRWQLFSRYAETPDQFVLLSADKGRVGVAFLPKRGLADAGDADRLREVLDRNITRIR